MQWEHCAFCGNLSLRPIGDGFKKCTKCGWEGIPDKKDMSEINFIAKNYKPGMQWAPPIKQKQKIDENNIDDVKLEENDNNVDLKEPVQKNLDPRKDSFRMSDAEANRSENLLSNKQISNKVPKNQELINRLKNKNFNGADFL